MPVRDKTTLPNHEIREGSFRPSSWDPEARTIEVVLSTGATVRRYPWYGDAFDEELVVDAASVILDRANNGAPFILDHRSHDGNSLLGSMVDGSARVEDGAVTATVRFVDTETAEARGVEAFIQEVGAGHRRNVSIGYRIKRREIVENDAAPDLHRITEWEILEGSSVLIGADDGAGFRSEGDKKMPNKKTPEIKEQADNVVQLTDAERKAERQAERRRCDEINRYAVRLGLTPDDERVRALIDGDVQLDGADGARAQLLAIDVVTEDMRGVTPQHDVTIGTDEHEKMRGAMADALVHRTGMVPGTKLEGDAGNFRHRSMLQLATTLLERRGMDVRSMSNPQIAMAAMGFRPDGTRMHGTNDFPLLTAAVTGKTLQAGFNEVAATYEIVAERQDLPNFDPARAVKLSGFPSLTERPENGSVVYRTVTEAQETWSLSDYADGFIFGWRLLLHDDLSAMARPPRDMGHAAARTRSNLFWSLFTTAIPTVTETGLALYHATHGNLVAAGGAPTPTQIAAMETLFDAQTDLDGTTLIDVPMSFIVFGPTHKQVMFQLLEDRVVPETVANRMTNAQLGLMPVFERRLAGNPYFGAGPKGQNGLTFGSLSGRPNPVISSMVDFDTSGIKFKVEDSFGAAAKEYRGLVQNPGA